MASVILEHEFSQIIDEQIANGFAFDLTRAADLYGEWSEERDVLKKSLVSTFPPVVEEMKTPEYWTVHTMNPQEGRLSLQYSTKSEAKKAGHKDKDIIKGPNRTKTIPFNPDSRQQISKCLI